MFANLNPACVARCRDAEPLSRRASRLSCCLSSRCRPVIVQLRWKGVKSPLDILLLHPLLVVLLPQLLVASPLVVLLLRCLLGFSSRRLALSSFCCAALFASHRAGWTLIHLSLRCPLVVSLPRLVVASLLPPLLLLVNPLVATAVDEHPIPVPMRPLSRVGVPLALKFATRSSKSNHQPSPLLPPRVVRPSPPR